jgi:hypothetical protein
MHTNSHDRSTLLAFSIAEDSAPARPEADASGIEARVGCAQEAQTGTTLPMSDSCPHCDAELTAGDDFCRNCGHSLDYRGDNADLFTPADEDQNAGDICPHCGATHMVTTKGGRHLCETCGFLG